MSSKTKVIPIITKYLMGVDPSGFNLDFYKKHHFSWPESKFKEWVEQLRDGKAHIVVYAPADSKVKLSFKRNLAFAEKNNIPIYERLWFEGNGEVPSFLTPVKYMVFPCSVRRQSQMLTKKISVPDNMKSINPLTAQPTGPSQSAKISLPESQLLSASGLEKSLIELLGPRGGDTSANAALKGMIVKTGKASLSVVKAFSSGVEVNKYMKAIFAGAHIKLGPL